MTWHANHANVHDGAHPKFPLNFGIIHCVKPILPQTKKIQFEGNPVQCE
jgi:hypothetical protein